MFLNKCIKSLKLIAFRQNHLNWCQIVANRRYLSQDNNGNDKNGDKSMDIFDKNSEESDDKVVKAKVNLNQLIDNLKSKTVFGESDPKLRELLAKPKTHIRRSARKEEELDTKDENINEISSEIDKRLVLAAKGIASTLSGDQSKKTENDLLRILKMQIVETNLAKEGKVLSKDQLGSLLNDMKVLKEDSIEDKSFVDFFFKKPQTMERTGRIDTRQDFIDREVDFQSRPKRRSYDRSMIEEQSVSQSLLKSRQKIDYNQDIETIGLFTGDGIGIFDPDMKEASDSPKMLIWDRLMKDELDYIIAQPPKNAFEEMIQWTEEGKLWKYPINNEQGLEEEEKVPFYEHVLLEDLLEGFPQSGPVRKFMELVIMGLSSNPYITVERKHATVQYYRKYFQDREDMLKVAGALG